jgi:hypothetical protein
MSGAVTRWLLVAGLLAFAWPLRAEGQPAQDARGRPPRPPRNAHFELIAHHPLPNPGGTIARGRNGPTGISGDCLYVGSRIGRRPGTGPRFGTPPLPPEVLIVDIAHPRRPRVVGTLPTLLNATARELRTLPDAHALILLNVQETAPAGGAENHYQIYDITDCRRPVLRQTISLGADRPHALFLWRDPHEPVRFLLYSSTHGDEPSLRVFELMAPPDGPISPTPVATFTRAPALLHAQPLPPFAWRGGPFDFDPVTPDVPPGNAQALSVSQDGTRVYVNDPRGGQDVLDSTRLANREPCIRDTVIGDEAPELCLRRLSPPPEARVGFAPRHARTEPPVPAVRTERLRQAQRPPPPERETPPGRLVFPHLSFVSGHSAGLRVWDTANPALPREVGAYVPKPAHRVVERFQDSPEVWMGPNPILYNGLLYVTDENSGLYVLRYKGPRAGELPRSGLYMSHTNYLAPPARPPARHRRPPPEARAPEES